MFNNTTTSGAGAVVPTPSSTVPTTFFPGTTITTNSTFIIFGPPPPFPAPPRSINLTPLILIFAVIAIIAVPTLVYALFPCSSLRRRSSSSRRSSFSDDHVTVDITSPNMPERGASTAAAPDSGVKFKKDTHSKEIGNECTVCLSVFADGEEIRRLSACQHAFHASCIETWLKDHPNCPICRADVAVKQTEANVNVNVNSSGGGNRRVPSSSLVWFFLFFFVIYLSIL